MIAVLCGLVALEVLGRVVRALIGCVHGFRDWRTSRADHGDTESGWGTVASLDDCSDLVLRWLDGDGHPRPSTLLARTLRPKRSQNSSAC